MEINYSPIKTFIRIHQDPNPYIFCRGPVGSGKSSGCVMHVFMNACRQSPDSEGIRKSRYGIIRATYPALRTTTIKTWKDWFKKEISIVYKSPIEGKISFGMGDGTKVEIELYFIALDKDDDVEKLQSLELTGAHINEAAEVPRAVLDMLKTRINRFPSKRDGAAVLPFIISDFNSVPIDHWLYKLAEEIQPPQHSFYHQPPAMLYDGLVYKINPLADNIENLPDNYYNMLVVGSDPDFVNVFVLNNYGQVRSGNPVFPLYVDSIHNAHEGLMPIKGLPLVIGLDGGLSPAAVFCQLDLTGRLLVLEEIVTDNTDMRTMLENYIWPRIYSKYSDYNFNIIVDPAATKRAETDKRCILDLIVEAGLPVRTAWTNEILARKESVNFFLRKRDGFLLDGIQAPMLRKGFISEYHYPKIKRSGLTSMYKEKPEKNIYSHAQDALQYVALEMSKGRTLGHRNRKYIQKYTAPADQAAGY